MTELPVRDAHLSPFRSRSLAFLPNGKKAISVILSALDLQPYDEIYITNSSGQTYISSCVTCTIFNYCQPTRVFTDSTRAILIIHEYGVPHPRTFELIAEGKKREIPVIEDCAHTYDSQADNGQCVGTLGDYTIYSLPKIFPVISGGILSGKKIPPFILNSYEESQAKEAERGFQRYGPFLQYFSQRRKQNFSALEKFFSNKISLLENVSFVTPYFYGVTLSNAAKIRREISVVEWGTTLQDDWLLIPTNPLVDADEYITVMTEALRGYV